MCGLSWDVQIRARCASACRGALHAHGGRLGRRLLREVRVRGRGAQQTVAGLPAGRDRHPGAETWGAVQGRPPPGALGGALGGDMLGGDTLRTCVVSPEPRHLQGLFGRSLRDVGEWVRYVWGGAALGWLY